ncbi:MAG: heat-inducible transcriptional repressor HrcA [Weeping tea tree witches'-broom phytoplasma]|uniref:heat-inducible transcriptional repressor HrcA n=1 Tax=Candidatus Phytoplasma melaleucae TaxID=2982630 RepID=UPI00293B4473|nr:heat-inducible transcriptional repressor HrcA [Weeping tea tree witches'-broom phytoplasma]
MITKGLLILLSNRRRLILKAIVENYSKHNQPVSSKFLSCLPYLNYSSATIRHDMAQLEKKGYLQKPHISSGRIPSLKGYVFYFNNLITRNHNVIEMISLFEKFFQQKNFNKESVIEKVLKLLGNLTHYAVILVRPNILKIHKLNKIYLISVNFKQVTIVVITDHGNAQCQNVNFNFHKNFTFENLRQIIFLLNRLLFDKYLYEAIEIARNIIIQKKYFHHFYNHESLIKPLIEIFYSFLANNFHVYGIYNFINNFISHDIVTVKEVLKLIESDNLSQIFFDYEKNICKLANRVSLTSYSKFAIISAPYNTGDGKSEKGFIAVLGPLMMKYQEIIPILEYLSAHLSQLYER